MVEAKQTVAGRARILASLLVLGVVCAPAADGLAAQKASKKSGQAAAQPAKSDDGGEKKDPAAAERAYAAGTKAYEAGDLAEAIKQLSLALASGGLPNSQIAKALYYRGTAYRKQGKPAQAISDLTTSVWLKGGLSDADRAQAMENRQAAYREAGLGETAPPIGSAPLDAAPAKPVEQAAPKPGVLVASAPTSSSFWNNFSLPTMPSLSSITGGSSAPAAAPAPATPPPVAAVAEAPAAQAPQQSSWQTATAASEAPVPQAVAPGFAPAEPASAPPTAVPLAAAQPSAVAQAAPASGTSISNPFSGAGTSIGGFFGNMFGSSTPAAATTTPSAGVATGSTSEAPHETQWGGATTVATAQTSSMVQRGPEEPPAPLPWSAGQTTVAAAGPAATPAVPVTTTVSRAGKFKLQVAAVRSREEAERLASTLSAYQAVQSGAVRPEIDEAVLGSMGTFYRVRLGPYADAKEPGQLCKTLRPQGFDCLVVTQ